MLVSWIHPCVCNNLLLSSWPFSSNPLIIVVARLYIYIHQTLLALWTWFWKQAQKAWYLPIRQEGGSESYSHWVLPVFCGRESQRSSVICSLFEDASSIFLLELVPKLLYFYKQRGILPTLVNTKAASVLYFCSCSELLVLRCLGFLIEEL